MSLAFKADELHLSAYDATYLLLAHKLECPLATIDKDFRRAAKSYGISIACLNHE
jgi:predicted nucleic acid-binding protein